MKLDVGGRKPKINLVARMVNAYDYGGLALIGALVANEKMSPRTIVFGGINTSVSQHNNSPLEFLNITNLDFRTAALSQGWGSTQYIGRPSRTH